MVTFQCKGMNVQINVSVRIGVDSFPEGSHVRGLFTNEGLLRSVNKNHSVCSKRSKVQFILS